MKFMDSNASSFSPSYSQSESPKIYINKAGGSGLTLVIPSLKSLKAQKSTNSTPASHTPLSYDVDTQEKRIPRPIKLKPLKEVLSKLIAQIKKKDDYAFFLHPVDVASVPGYSDVVKRPMDLGTMTEKVSRGKYRSLEDFASDLKLVTTNAKLFNPPGSIYHTEADRLEIWALDHISKAATTVIQYETDWNIEIEKDDEGTQVNVDDDEDFQPMGTPMDVDGQNHHSNMSAMAAALTGLRERSMSSQPQPGPSRRGPRGPYKKQTQATGLSETLEPDGGLPGSKDGLGSFPPGSDWAKTMVALKLKGKKYRTKKERLRIEREGPPLLADGSLDYTEMEDPFSVLSYFVPEPPSRPHLVPLYPPLYNPPLPQQQQGTDPSSSQNQTPHPAPPPAVSTFPTATTLPLDHAPPDLPLLQTLTSTPASVSGGGVKPPPTPPPPPQQQQQPTRRKHWNIVRNATWRKGKEREDEMFQLQYQHPYQQHLHQPQYQQATSPVVDVSSRNGILPTATAMADFPAWRMPRPAQAMDFGSFAVLAGELAEETRRRGMMPVGGGGGGEMKENADWEVTRDLLYWRLGCESRAKTTEVEGGGGGVQVNGDVVQQQQQQGGGGSEAEAEAIAKLYWTTQRAAEAEEYVRDMVYGGVEGLAYVRSLAEFVDGDCYYKEEPSGEQDEDENQNAATASTSASTPVPISSLSENPSSPPPSTGLGTSLSNWVVTNIIDPLTDGRHTLLNETATALLEQHQKHLQHLNRTNSNSNSTDTNKPQTLPLLSLSEDPRKGTISSQVEASLKLYPRVVWALHELRRVGAEKIDMGALIRRPDELFLSEEEWVGKKMKEERRRKGLERLRKEVVGSVAVGGMKEDGDSAMVVDGPQVNNTQSQSQSQVPIPAGLDPTALKERLSGRLSTYEQEGPAELNEVLEHVANAIVELDGKIRERMRVEARGKEKEEEDGESEDEDKRKMKVEEQPSTSTTTVASTTTATTSTSSEDPAIRNIRLNLLALAKRAPLDTIARLPKDLVPEHIRHFVPTLGSTG